MAAGDKPDAEHELCSHPAFFVQTQRRPKPDFLIQLFGAIPSGEANVIEFLALLLAVPILCLLSLSCVPSRRADALVCKLRRLVPSMLGLQSLLTLALTGAIASGNQDPLSISCFELSKEMGLGFGIYFDGTSSLMLLMVSMVGFVVSWFSIRYLDGEAMQGRYFRWLGFTAGAVSLMVIAGNLLLFFAAWVMTSSGLHQLLLHYRHRAAAHRAAWTKFAISRLGDGFLIAALVLTFKSFGTYELASIFEQAKGVGADSQANASQLAIGWLIVLGAVTKSAQFPFHTWLPDTMETPTPVSALMHAGIVNAGGYLIIRMSPLVALAPEALTALAAIGAFTACFAGIVMMTQPSIKRALAYSTIAQMGFMMLQCGLGAFSAAMLHILAHSFYKAHAFLSSGSVMEERKSMMAAAPLPASLPNASLASLLAAFTMTLTAFVVASYTLGFNLADKSGGLVLVFILTLALTTWGWRLLALGNRAANVVAITGIPVLCFAYLAGYLCVNHLVSPATPELSTSKPPQLVLLDVCLAFFALFLLHIVLVQRIRPNWLEPLRIHAANGFYVDAIYQRVFGSIART